MDWFMHHPVILGLVGAGVAVAYGLYLTWWLLRQPDGNDRLYRFSSQQPADDFVERNCGCPGK